MSTEKRDFIKETPRLVEKIYDHNGIKIGVRIDFVQKQISLIEFENNNSRGSIKKWVFANRGIEFEQGWQRILTAMGYAISEAKKELKDFIEQEEKEKVELIVEAHEAIENSK